MWTNTQDQQRKSHTDTYSPRTEGLEQKRENPFCCAPDEEGTTFQMHVVDKTLIFQDIKAYLFYNFPFWNGELIPEQLNLSFILLCQCFLCTPSLKGFYVDSRAAGENGKVMLG